MSDLTVKELNQRSIKSRRATAKKRREKIKALKEQGRSGPEIAAELGIKIRLVYQDFSILKREAKSYPDD